MENSIEYIIDVISDILPDIMVLDKQDIKRVEANLLRIIIHVNYLANRNKELEKYGEQNLELTQENSKLKGIEEKYNIMFNSYKAIITLLRADKTGYADYRKLRKMILEDKELNKKLDKVFNS